ncbi:MAG: hypothetical protein VKP62_15185 [Candidatus Sericytochromatia bacterium]|nr:hypothetical protein [Candidatus Sericytochromatia bacterium]
MKLLFLLMAGVAVVVLQAAHAVLAGHPTPSSPGLLALISNTSATVS